RGFDGGRRARSFEGRDDRVITPGGGDRPLRPRGGAQGPRWENARIARAGEVIGKVQLLEFLHPGGRERLHGDGGLIGVGGEEASGRHLGDGGGGRGAR